jgi:hypothetical protein
MVRRQRRHLERIAIADAKHSVVGNFAPVLLLGDRFGCHNSIAFGVIKAILRKPNGVAWIAKGNNLPASVLTNLAQSQNAAEDLKDRDSAISFAEEILRRAYFFAS